MIAHDPKAWFSWPNHFHRSDTVRRLFPWILLVCAYSALIAWLEMDPIVGFIFYVLASLELIAEEIEEPFGADENDLPLGKMARGIKVHIHELI